jgi:hypothetical protein
MTMTNSDQLASERRQQISAVIPGGTAERVVVTGGSTAEAVAGIGVIILAVLGLVNVAVLPLASIATIAAGVGFVLRGTSLATRSRAVARQDDRATEAEFFGGLAAEVVGGAGATVLGILALLGVAQTTVLPVALIVLGSTLLLGGTMTPLAHNSGRILASPVSTSAAGGDGLFGLGALTLGILGLIGVGDPIVLLLTGLLPLGAGLVLESSPMIGRMFTRK